MQVAVISAKSSLPNLLRLQDEMKALCSVDFYPYASMESLARLFLDIAPRYDGFLFSGTYPYDYLVKQLGPIQKPCQWLDLNERDYYLILAKLMVSCPNIDFSRVYFDTPSMGMSAFHDVLPGEKLPQFIISYGPQEYIRHLDTFYDEVMEVYRDIWNSGKADLFVIHFSNLKSRMEAEGIPCLLQSPAPATVMENFRELMNKIQHHRIETSLSACCVLQIADPMPGEQEFAMLEKNLNRFNTEQNTPFVIHRHNDMFEAMTSNAVMNELTKGGTTCLLTSFLYEVLPFHTTIGWGVGPDVVTAHRNALRAMQESRRDNRRYTYLVNENYEMVGPLTGDRSVSYIIQPDNRMQYLSKLLGISATNLSKINSLIEKKHMNEFSSGDLVFYLNITPRSATRILKKLSECGGAKPVRHAQLNSKGRPSMMYQINLNDIDLTSLTAIANHGDDL